MRRCQWCKRFVSADMPLARRQARGADGTWRLYEQVLCARCRRAALAPSDWNRPLPDAKETP